MTIDITNALLVSLYLYSVKIIFADAAVNLLLVAKGVDSNSNLIRSTVLFCSICLFFFVN